MSDELLALVASRTLQNQAPATAGANSGASALQRVSQHDASECQTRTPFDGNIAAGAAAGGDKDDMTDDLDSCFGFDGDDDLFGSDDEFVGEPSLSAQQMQQPNRSTTSYERE